MEALRKILNRRIVPPGGRYFYRVPETGMEFNHPTSQGLLQAVRGHYAANQIAVPANLWDLIEDYICRHVPESFCSGRGTSVRTITLHEIRTNTQKLLARGRVTPGEASRRVDICLQCEFNDRRMCPTCVGLVAWAKRLVASSVPRDEWLGVCAVDGTALPAKIHLCPRRGEGEYPTACWVGKDVLYGSNND